MAEPNTRSLIALAREEASPSEREVEDLFARLSRAPGPDGGGEPQAPAGGTGWGAVAVILLVAAGLVGLALVMRTPVDTTTSDRAPVVGSVERTKATAPAQPDHPADSATAPSGRDVASEHERPAETIVGDGATDNLGVKSTGAAEGKRSVASVKARPRKPSKRTADDDLAPEGNDLAKEVALLHKMREAVRDAEWAAVDRLVQEHRTDFPKGVLKAEVGALDTVARCTAATPDVAAEIGRRYLVGGHARYAARISQACGLPPTE